MKSKDRFAFLPLLLTLLLAFSQSGLTDTFDEELQKPVGENVEVSHIDDETEEDLPVVDEDTGSD